MSNTLEDDCKGGEMFLIKVSLLFCGVAFAIAGVVSLALVLGSQFVGTFLISSTHRGWIGLLVIWWAASFLLALGIAKIYHIFPPFVPK
jgi:hypothetical protein